MLFAATNNPLVGYLLIAALLVFWAGTIVWGRSLPTVCQVGVEHDLVVITLLGPARILSLRKRVAFPLDSVLSVQSTPNVFSKQGTFGRRIGSLTIPTFFRVGAFRAFRDQGPAFWACFRGDTAITFNLENHRFHYVVIDVADPSATLSLLAKYGI